MIMKGGEKDMIRVDINECQTGQCEECGTYTYRILTVAEYQFYFCNKCTETLFSTLKFDEYILEKQFK